MVDAELIRHQQIWHGFTRFVKITTVFVVILMGFLFAFVF